MYSTDKDIAPVKAFIQVAKNNYYELCYDETSNRIYFTLTGYWKNKDVVPDYLNDWQKILKLTRQHFSVLADLRTMVTHPPHLNNLHLKALALVQGGGIEKMAQVNPTDRIATLQMNQLTAQCSLPLSQFSTTEEASEWLNKS